MITELKIYIYQTKQNQIIYWCLTLMMLFIGLIIQLEATAFSFVGMIFWVLAILMLLYGIFGYRIIVMEDKAQIILRRLFFKQKKIDFKNIKEIELYKRNVRIKTINPKYIHHDFLICLKNKNKLIDTLKKNNVKILSVKNNFL